MSSTTAHSTAPRMMKGVVAKGRSIMAGGEPLRDASGAVVGGNVGTRHYLPGEEVELPEDEYREAIEHGFLVNPEAPAPTVSTGPVIHPTGDNSGPRVGRISDGDRPMVGRITP